MAQQQEEETVGTNRRKVNKVTNKNPNAVTPVKYDKEYSEFERIIEGVGILNIVNVKVAEQLGVSEALVSYWKKAYLKTIDFNLERLGKQINHQGAVILKRLALHASSENPQMAVIAGKTFLDCADKYTVVLERLGVIKRDPLDDAPLAPTIIEDEEAYKLMTPRQRELLILRVGGVLPDKPKKKNGVIHHKGKPLHKKRPPVSTGKKKKKVVKKK